LRRGSTRRGEAPREGWQGEPRDDVTLGEVRHALAERWVILVVCALVALGVFLIYSALREPSFTAEAQVEIRPLQGDPSATDVDNDVSSVLNDSAVTDGLDEQAARAAGWDGSLREFNDSLEQPRASGAPAGGTSVVTVRFTDPSPAVAARSANAYAEAFVGRLEELQGRLAGGSVNLSGEVVREAEVPPGGRFSAVAVGALAAAGCGLIVGGVAALFLDGRARRWSGSRDAELTLRAPVLGVIPDYSDTDPAGVDHPVPDVAAPARPAAPPSGSDGGRA